MITGTIRNAVQMQALNNKWEQKKKEGNVLSKQERNERASWTQDQRMMNDFKEQLEKDKENGKKNEIANKISSGQQLTPDEEKYLASYDPQGYAEYKQTQNERKAYEEKLKHCKTKDEVHRMKTNAIGGYLSSFKKIVNNPNISISEKLKQAQQFLGKVRNIDEAEKKFIATGKYAKLPTEAEQQEERAEERELENELRAAKAEENNEEMAVENDESLSEEITSDESLDNASSEKMMKDKNIASDTSLEQKVKKHKAERKADEPQELMAEFEVLYNHLKLSSQLEKGSDRKVESESEKYVGKKVNLSV